ncbi:MAG: SDR family NAD(P)-dependent oxidoreductase, partial [Pseudomonadaceae bacterium]|nr:SDR family NAD(P)-dependent oxidoreductase [Pseudomonadaceae bacterium]
MKKTDLGLKEFKADFSDRVVLVTGASRGIGRAIALAFARCGAKLVIHARNEGRLAAVAGEIRDLGGEVLSRSLDVAIEEDVIAGIDEAERHFGAVHILVNNAGIYQTLPMLGHPTETWHSILNTNLTAAFFYSRQLVKGMLDSGWGRIINISSISGKHAEIHGAAYSAS